MDGGGAEVARDEGAYEDEFLFGFSFSFISLMLICFIIIRDVLPFL